MASSDFYLRQQQNLKRRTGPSSGPNHSTSTSTITVLGPPAGNTYTIVVTDGILDFHVGSRIRITNHDNLSVWAEGSVTNIVPPSTLTSSYTITFVSDRENTPGTSSNWLVHLGMPKHRSFVMHFSDTRNPDPGDANDGDVWVHVDTVTNTLVFEMKVLGTWTTMLSFTAPIATGGAGSNSSSGGDSGGDGGGAE